MATDQAYIGQELSIFAHAINWKKYYTSIVQPYFGQRVVEVGAGIGATTAVMCDGTQTEWICLEPDAALRTEIDRLISSGKLPACCQTRGGYISDLLPKTLADTIIYIDVLEHIENDRIELETASAHLSSGGRLIVLSPAFNFLYSPFDKSIGHYRRYDRKMLAALTPSNCRVKKIIYLDSLGMATSLVNRFLLSQAMPTIAQIKFWDTYLIPISKSVDRVLGYRFGRSLLGIWVKT
jgi:methyltransferase family protein